MSLSSMSLSSAPDLRPRFSKRAERTLFILTVPEDQYGGRFQAMATSEVASIRQ